LKRKSNKKGVKNGFIYTFKSYRFCLKKYFRLKYF
jgi:hypothetical protein